MGTYLQRERDRTSFPRTPFLRINNCTPTPVVGTHTHVLSPCPPCLCRRITLTSTTRTHTHARTHTHSTHARSDTQSRTHRHAQTPCTPNTQARTPHAHHTHAHVYRHAHTHAYPHTHTPAHARTVHLLPHHVHLGRRLVLRHPGVSPVLRAGGERLSPGARGERPGAEGRPSPGTARPARGEVGVLLIVVFVFIRVDSVAWKENVVNCNSVQYSTGRSGALHTMGSFDLRVPAGRVGPRMWLTSPTSPHLQPRQPHPSPNPPPHPTPHSPCLR